MKTRPLSLARRIACGLALLGSFAFGCDAKIDALGSSELGLSTSYPNPDVCPEAPSEAMRSADELGDLTELAACSDVPPGTICAYDVRSSDGDYNGWLAYVCGCKVEGNWKNVGTAIEGYACPDPAPVAGAPCDALPGPCPYYPDQQAYCVDGAWKYYEAGPRYLCDALGIIAP